MQSMSWDELRRQARSLENELDTKLATYSGLSTKPNVFRSVTGVSKSGSSQSLHFVVSNLGEPGERIPVSSSTSDPTRLGEEIEQLLQRLDRINDQMTELVRDLDAPPPVPEGSLRPPIVSTFNTGMTAGQLSQVHTAKRHREILRDYTQEFRQAKAKLAANREREELLGSVYHDSSGNPSESSNHRSSSGGQSSATRLLLDEQERYYRSNRLMDENLAIASAVRSKLHAQRATLRNVSSGLHGLTTRFPRIKQLLSRIDWRHRKDSIVLGLVIASCVAFLVIYRFS